MKIIITPVDQAKALNNMLQDVYGLDVNILADDLQEMTVDIEPIRMDKPRALTQEEQKKVEDNLVIEDSSEDEDVEREWAEERANELGLSYRSDIKTSTLISRIEDEEERIAREARQPDPLPLDDDEQEDILDDIASETSIGATSYGSHDYDEDEEVEPKKTKPSIFNITKKADDVEEDEEEEEVKPRSNFFDKIKKKDA